MPLVIFTLRLIWRFRVLMAIAFFVMLGHIWLNRFEDFWNASHEQNGAQSQTTTIWCDPNPGPRHIPFVPADKCGGWTSCDRLYNNLGTCSNPK
jgi:hypothetical protein